VGYENHSYGKLIMLIQREKLRIGSIFIKGISSSGHSPDNGFRIFRRSTKASVISGRP
jgi:hypothetical protein